MICTLILLSNITVYELNAFDVKSLNRAKQVCKTRYKGCLKKFQKYDKKDYRALCGEPEYGNIKDLKGASEHQENSRAGKAFNEVKSIEAITGRDIILDSKL